MVSLFKDSNGKHTRMPFDTAKAFENRFKRIWNEYWVARKRTKHRVEKSTSEVDAILNKKPKLFDVNKAKTVVDNHLKGKYFYSRYVGKDVNGWHSWIVVQEPLSMGDPLPEDIVATLGLVRLVKGNIIATDKKYRSGWQLPVHLIFDLPNWHVLGQMIAREDVSDPMKAFEMVVDGLAEGVFKNLAEWHNVNYNLRSEGGSFTVKTEKGLLIVDVLVYHSYIEKRNRNFTLVRTYYTNEMITPSLLEDCINPGDFE